MTRYYLYSCRLWHASCLPHRDALRHAEGLCPQSPRSAAQPPAPRGFIPLSYRGPPARPSPGPHETTPSPGALRARAFPLLAAAPGPSPPRRSRAVLRGGKGAPAPLYGARRSILPPPHGLKPLAAPSRCPQPVPPVRTPLSPQPYAGAAATAPREPPEGPRCPALSMATRSRSAPRSPSNAPSLWSLGQHVASAAGPQRPRALLAAARPPRGRHRLRLCRQPRLRAVSAALGLPDGRRRALPVLRGVRAAVTALCFAGAAVRLGVSTAGPAMAASVRDGGSRCPAWCRATPCWTRSPG